MIGSRRRRQRKGSGGERTRIYFVSDIHGSERCFRKWLNAASVYEVDCLVLGGDVTGKVLVPLAPSGDGWRGQWAGQELIAADEDELAELRAQVAIAGAYLVTVSSEQAECLASDQEEVEEVLREAMVERLREWVQLADERLADSEVPAFVMLGNDDEEDFGDVFAASERLVYAENRVVELPGGHEMLAMGCSTPTPWNTPRELSEEEMGARIEALAAGLERPESAILNLHCPPRNTHLDQAPQLDEELRPIVRAGGVEVGPVGSQAVRDAIEAIAPALGLHGHVHESPGAQQLGRTLCVNPGSEFAEGILRGAIVDLAADGSVLQWQLVEG